MGNSSSNEQTQENTAVENSTTSVENSTSHVEVPPVSMPTSQTPVVSVTTMPPVIPKLPVKKTAYVHPLIEMINKHPSEAEMINTLQAFCGRTEIGCDANGNPVYESVDQLEFFGPVMAIFSYCATNNKKSVVEWLCSNYVPLQVSYDNNYIFFECLRWNQHNIVEIIVNHESFNPTMEVLKNLLSRSKHQQFKKCMSSPYLRGDLQTYRFTFMYYVDQNQHNNLVELLKKIEDRMSNENVEINDEIHPNPRLVQLQQQNQNHSNAISEVMNSININPSISENNSQTVSEQESIPDNNSQTVSEQDSVTEQQTVSEQESVSEQQTISEQESVPDNNSQSVNEDEDVIEYEEECKEYIKYIDYIAKNEDNSAVDESPMNIEENSDPKESQMDIENVNTNIDNSETQMNIEENSNSNNDSEMNITE